MAALHPAASIPRDGACSAVKRTCGRLGPPPVPFHEITLTSATPCTLPAPADPPENRKMTSTPFTLPSAASLIPR